MFDWLVLLLHEGFILQIKLHVVDLVQRHLGGLALPDVLGILKTACHNEWDEVGQLVADPRLLVRQAAAVKYPAATFEIRLDLETEDRAITS